MMFVTTGPLGDEAGICGSFRDNPDAAIEAATQAMATLYTYAARKHFDPLTATNF